MKRRMNILIPLFLFTLAFLTRVYRFGAVPGGFNQDEAMAAYDAFSLALYGTDRFGMPFPAYFTAWGYGQMSVLLSYAMVPFIKMFGLSVVTARLPILLCSMLGLAALYFFCRDAFGPRKAWVVLAFAAINPWQIMQARWALDCNMFPHLLMIAVYLLHKGISGTRYGDICRYLSMVVFGLSMYAYGIAFYTVPLLLVSLCVYLLSENVVTVKNACLCAGIYILVAWPIFGVILVNYFHWPTLYTPFITIPFFPNSVRVRDLLFFSPDMPGQLLKNLASLSQIVVLQKDGLPWNAVTGYGTLYNWSLPFTFVGLIVGLVSAEYKKRGSVFILIWLAVALLSGLIVNGVNINRVNIIFYPLILLTGLGIYETVMLPIRIRRNKSQVLRLTSVVVAVILAVLSVISFSSFSRVYFNEHNRTLSVLFYDDFFKCLDYVKQENYDRLYVTAWTQSPGYANVSEILTLFGLRIDPALFLDKAAYQERYRYTVFTEIPQSVSEAGEEVRTVYIFNWAERHYFPEEIFNITPFGGFGTAERKHTGTS